MKNSKYYRLKRVSDKNRRHVKAKSDIDKLLKRIERDEQVRKKEIEFYKERECQRLEEYKNSSIITKIGWKIDEVFEWLCEKLFRL